MAFLSLGSDYLRAGYTQVDNVFLLSYLPYADALDVKIYLLGLVIASDASEENSLEKTQDRTEILFHLFHPQSVFNASSILA